MCHAEQGGESRCSSSKDAQNAKDPWILYLATDMYGRYINCLQCGFTRDLPDTLTPAKPVESAGAAYQPEVRKAA